MHWVLGVLDRPRFATSRSVRARHWPRPEQKAAVLIMTTNQGKQLARAVCETRLIRSNASARHEHRCGKGAREAWVGKRYDSVGTKEQRGITAQGDLWFTVLFTYGVSIGPPYGLSDQGLSLYWSFS